MRNSYSGGERFNFLLALVGFLRNRGPVTIEEAADAFELDAAYIRKAVTTLNEARAQVSGFEEWFFMIDIDALENDGILSLLDNLVVDEMPKLSNRQAAAIATGLSYLESIPTFRADPELAELIQLFVTSQGRGINPMVEVRPGSAEAGAETIRKAIIAGKRIQCEYINQKGERTIRNISPLRLDNNSSGWYLRGFCPLHNEVRNFKLDRMRAIEVTADDIPESDRNTTEFDDVMYVADANDVSVTVEVEPEAYRLIADFVDISEPSSIASGRIRAEIKVGHLPNIARLISRFGGAAKVIAPPEAKKIVRDFALRAIGESASEEFTNEG
ncbi:MAG: helix-turn-helix transcriptional regulator [Rhodoluna sp.]